jgi:hypothetical protein
MLFYPEKGTYPEVDLWLRQLADRNGFDQPELLLIKYYLTSSIIWFLYILGGIGVWKQKKWGPAFQLLLIIIKTLIILLFFNISYFLYETSVYTKAAWGILFICSGITFLTCKRKETKAFNNKALK